MKRIGLRNLVIDALFFNKINTLLLKSLFKRCGATVLIYHLVCDSDFHRFMESEKLSRIGIDLFKKHLVWLLDNGFSFVTIDELARKILNKEKIGSKIIALTFDDGFKITIKNALPILESLNIKTTFYITAGWVDSKVLLWQQKYYWYLNKFGLQYFFEKISKAEGGFLPDLSLCQCHQKFMNVVMPDKKAELLNKFQENIPDEEKIASEIYPSSEDLVNLIAAGMQIGSHSCGHFFMHNLPEELYLEEMLRSKQKLENITGHPVMSFSYPFNSYREDEELIKKAGFQTVCTVNSAKVDSMSLLTKLPRFDAPVRSSLFRNSLRKILYYK
jgi:peptidoglycan/xylan/chitin deacetylase (PgdA/CDA1 family)